MEGEPRVKNFGEASAWDQPPDMVVRCIEQKHVRSDKPRYIWFSAERYDKYHREVRCDICGYVYYYEDK